MDRREWLQYGAAFCTPLVAGGAALAYCLSARPTGPLVSTLLALIPLGFVCVPVAFIVVPFVRWGRRGFPDWTDRKMWLSPDSSPALVGLTIVFFIGMSGVYFPALIVFEQTHQIVLSFVVLSTAVPLIITFGAMINGLCPPAAKEALTLEMYSWWVPVFSVLNGLNIAFQLQVRNGALQLRTEYLNSELRTFRAAGVLAMCAFVIGLLSMAPAWYRRYWAASKLRF